jgi:outer membrane lipoprotein-sorting protein
MAGTSQAAFLGILLSGWVAIAPAAMAEPVPLPPPAPQPKAGAVPPPPSSIPAAKPGTAAPDKSTGSNWFNQFFGGKPAAKPNESVALDATQKALVDKISAYLSSVQTMTGDFAQMAPDGKQSKGQFYIQKPGKVRFEYEAPVPIDIVADGQSVVVRDRKLATQDIYPLSQTPLRFLLTERIDLLKDTTVVGVYSDQAFVTVVVEEKQALIGTSRLMMMFDPKDLKLKQWTVTDPQGYDTTIVVSNLDNSKKPDPNLFRIDYTRYSQ